MTKQGHRAQKHSTEINKFDKAKLAEFAKEESKVRQESEKYADKQEQHREFVEQEKLRNSEII